MKLASTGSVSVNSELSYKYCKTLNIRSVKVSWFNENDILGHC